MTVEPERNRAVVRSFVEAVNARNWDRFDGLLAPDFRRHSAAAGSPPVRSREELKTYLRSEFVTFPDAIETIEDILAEGDRVAVRHHFRGTQRGPLGRYPPSGKLMEADYIAIYRLEDGRIAESWAEWDNLSGLTQLGHHGPNVLPLNRRARSELNRRTPRPVDPNRFAVKLLFQFRVMVKRDPGIRRLCEERIVVLEAEDVRAALAQARRRGRAAEFRYENSDGNPVHFEFVGVLDLIELGSECKPGEVWYDLVHKVNPMERRKKLLPASLNRFRR